MQSLTIVGAMGHMGLPNTRESRDKGQPEKNGPCRRLFWAKNGERIGTMNEEGKLSLKRQAL